MLVTATIFILTSCSNQSSPKEEAIEDSAEARTYVHRNSDEAVRRIDEAKKRTKYGWNRASNTGNTLNYVKKY